MNEVLHLATDKDIVGIWSVIINIFYLLIAGVIGGFLTNWWKRKKYLLDKQRLEYEIELSRNKIETDKKSLRQQMITNNIAPMRQAWINDLRKTSSEIISHLNFIVQIKLLIKAGDITAGSFYVEHKAKYYELLRQINYLELLLPVKEDGTVPIESDSIKNNLENILKKLSNESQNNNIKKIEREIEQLSITIRILLKKEWEVTKSLKEIE
ncbi:MULTISPECIES: hypothetical protein [Proteus]|uniref:hypothetical protein n=1 Tax=Proteus TaxID=583 RepID=UPI0013309F6E|nr:MULTISPECIES: hypothetical protein [Proteus]MBG3007316.1 hypothetical protein [Proteus mirabilis]MCL8609795.1 hypothetical protein [Proteus mirabilis]MDK7001408.1 hypothetical protein [Proteus mirabilis]MDK7019774.1 hypothetical protein [Proteus mirabilis]MDK8621623.1 hypothetical protein [Proteus mirabilis]